jgi:hypothetical protein
MKRRSSGSAAALLGGAAFRSVDCRVRLMCDRVFWLADSIMRIVVRNG